MASAPLLGLLLEYQQSHHTSSSLYACRDRDNDNNRVIHGDYNNALSLEIGIMVLDFLIKLYSSMKCDAAAVAVAFATARRGLATVVPPALLRHLLVCKHKVELKLIRQHHQQE